MAPKTQLDDEVLAMFRDPAGSQVVSLNAHQIVAPTLAGAAITVEEQMTGGGVRIVQLVLDASPSMEPVANLLLTDFNAEFKPAINEARADDVSALRFGGLVFSSDIIDIWGEVGPDGNKVYFHKLEDLPPLTRAEYDPQRGYATALHQAIINGTSRPMMYAGEVERETGIAPDVDVLVLSDGANNENPRSPIGVKTLIESVDKTRVRFMFFYFETGGGLADPMGYARDELGFDEENIQVFAAKPGETQEERRKRFRRMLRVMSRVSASKGATPAAAAVAVTQIADQDIF